MRTRTRLADGRELIYYDSGETPRRPPTDPRPLPSVHTGSQIRRDPLTGDPVALAAHRQGRTYHPPADECPLCPSREGRQSEIPAEDYQVVAFENRFPSLSGDTGRCEVVCFTSDHRLSFADLDESQARLVLDAWTDRTAELSARPEVEQVYCFENRGADIGVTLGHPHGQIYAFPYVTPRTAKMLRRVEDHLRETGRNLFDDVLADELAAPVRVVASGEHWVAHVPYAARWPYEVHLRPRRRVPDLTALDEPERAELPSLYLELLRRFDRLFLTPESPDRPSPTPYISAWHQAPRGHREQFALHLQLFTIRRTADKLKYLAGTESGMEAFIGDVTPEAAAERLREVAS
ncbi:galactose-1-phosphate uridylyltransferase [Streptomyces tardus]|uniref:galactose-1-phosphate uridylyltransferase n=1 Tax=Streptomyces tardus TaxID=2780544 RepID=UPI0027E550B0|nr:galactose-1-phosphate uridylyltransferase [Streptomyces tardus]